MDSPEDDVSARVLLKRVLHTEQPRSPVTRSANNVRRSMRMKNTPRLESPGSALRHRLKKKLHESAAASPLPSPKRQRSAVSKPDPPVVTQASSTLFDDDMTTRGLLRGIIHMETETSLLMSGQPALQESEANPAESSVSSAGERTEGLSGAELSDLTLHTEPLTHVVKGLSRRKQQCVFNVSSFEKQFDQLPENTEEVLHVSQGVDVSQEKPDTSQDLDFSAGSKSGLNLTLKTPFVEKHTKRAGLQRKVSNWRPQSVDAFDEAVQKFLEQGHNQEHSVFLAGKTLEDSSWQKFTLGLNDVTELYIQTKKDDTVGPSAEMDSDAQGERENLENHVSEVHNVQDSMVLNQDEMVSPSQDDEEVVASSQEERDNVFLDTEYDIVLAPTQAMTEPLPESQNAELDQESAEGENGVNVEDVAHEEVVGDVEEIEIEENLDALHYPEQITRRAHRSEGGGAVLNIPAASRVTKSFGAGLNPREKDLLDLVDGSRESLEDVPDEEIQAADSPVSPQLYPAAEISTSEQHEASLTEDDLPQLGERNDAPEEEREELTDLEPANQTSELVQDEEELMDSEPANQSTEPTQDEAEDIMESELANQSREPPEEAEEEEIMESELANQSPEPVLEEEEEEEEEIIDSEPANQSPEFVQEEDEDEEEDDDDDDDARSAELSIKTPAFVRQKRVFSSPTAQPAPTVLKEVNAGPTPQVSRRAPRQKRQTEANVLPKSYVMSVFKHFAKTKVASDVYPAINEILKKYFDRLADDLETYATHAKRKTIEVEDFELLMRRQGFVTDSMPVNVLIEKYLPLEYRKLLIPVATSGNKVIPTQRR